MDHDGDIPMPINSSYGGVHHLHDPPHMPILHAASSLVVPPPCPPPPPPSSNGNGYDKKVASHHVVRYRECMKNHAASMGGNATDGCGEFMPSGEEGSIEALTCSACNCHRNFHRKEIQGDPPVPASADHFYHQYRLGRSKLIHLAGGGHHHKTTTSNMLLPPPPEAFGYSRAGGGVSSHGGQMVMSYNMQQQVSAYSGDDDREEEGEEHRYQVGGGKMKKRFRTKFTQEQKEKMLKFAERVGWKIQKQEEGVVQQLCQELGINRRVLKVWMHNNKHTYNKNNNPASTTATTTDHHHHHAQQLN